MREFSVFAIWKSSTFAHANVQGFRHSQEFKAVFNDRLRQGPPEEYYTSGWKKPLRSFWEQYVAKKVFNWQYLRYKMVDGQLTYDPNGYCGQD